MTGTSSTEPPAGADDQTPLTVTYGHGRMPGFMKVAWVLFIVFITYYVARFLIPAAGEELSK